ncbi:Aste57867_23427 [Aphanomyces stellatus]|uniref:Aste57867_23427 protein n=1 Tax=Aphanomyces stellatus TaxID=120398 RepID=A0A485LPB7_9STRA|nr:hypothetical protein As57867_023356 [Aphanomyces stellatus]VFU00073.1 Aste57867_23427 [Aphanomyces stellatus]
MVVIAPAAQPHAEGASASHSHAKMNHSMKLTPIDRPISSFGQSFQHPAAMAPVVMAPRASDVPGGTSIQPSAASRDANHVNLIQQAPSNRPPQAVPSDRGADANGLIVGYWKVGVCDFYTDWFPNCVMSFLCPCVALAQVTHRIAIAHFFTMLLLHGVLMSGAYVCSGLRWRESIQYNHFLNTKLAWVDERDTLSMEDTVAAALSILDANAAAAGRSTTYAAVLAAFAVASGLVVWYVRAIVRQSFRIPGTIVEDVAFSFVCPWCAIAQMATQTDTYEDKTWRFRPRDTLPGYVVSPFQVFPMSDLHMSPPSLVSVRSSMKSQHSMQSLADPAQ